MIRIICPKCKDAYLESKDNALTCPACESSFDADMENLFLGAQYYNECDYNKANDCLMKYIVKNGADAQAIFYKALCDGFCYDEDTISLTETYDKLLASLKEIPEELFPKYLALANDEAEKLEKAVAQSHIHLFVDADAEKIKKEVTTIINLQNEAKTFRVRLNALTNDYNEKATAKLSVRFSECFLVEPEIATQVGDLKFRKITENVASHTVFTGILSTDIKNLEIYYRCIVMFFKKNRQKYDFLMASAEKFTELTNLLENGQYTTIKGTSTIGDKLKAVGYDFFQESLKDNDDDFETQTETVVILEAPEEEKEEITEFEDISSTSTENVEKEESDIVEDEENSAVDESTETPEEDAITESDTIVEIPVDSGEETELTEDVAEEVAEDSVEEPSEDTSDAEIIAEDIAEEDVIEIDSATADVTEETVEEETTESTKEEIIEEVVQEVEDTATVEVPAVTEPAKKVKRKKSYAPFITVFVILAGIAAIICATVIPQKINEQNYASAQELMSNQKYAEAVKAYAELGEYEDSAEMLKLAKYKQAAQLEAAGKYEEAKAIYKELGTYEDSMAKVSSCTYNIAIALLDSGKFDDAKAVFETITDYADSKDKVTECDYQKAITLVAEKKYRDAIKIFKALGDYSESKAKILDAKYKYVNDHLSKDDKITVKYLEELIEERYLDSAVIRRKLLGATALADGVSSCINYDKDDFTTDLTEVENSKPFYFHVTVADAELYGKRLTAKFTTSVGYTERKSVTFTEGDNTYSLTYPRTSVSNYSVEFSLVTADGTELVKQSVEIK